MVSRLLVALERALDRALDRMLPIDWRGPVTQDPDWACRGNPHTPNCPDWTHLP